MFAISGVLLKGVLVLDASVPVAKDILLYTTAKQTESSKVDNDNVFFFQIVKTSPVHYSSHPIIIMNYNN